MKFLVIAVCLIGLAYSASVDDAAAAVLRSTFEQAPEGFQYAYETANGISGQASGAVKPTGNKDEVALEVQGSSEYKSPEGQTFRLTYVANENGYQPQADFLPTPPPTVPIPDYIARSIEYIAAHPYKEKA